ncbi:hypothetical protein GQ53DRAFT_817976 [Thozetella sp. PMI_491]|nr:hypothetical protein GQ53DRAFT_817976 [Thozetella sp. PMI_491]
MEGFRLLRILAIFALALFLVLGPLESAAAAVMAGTASGRRAPRVEPESALNAAPDPGRSHFHETVKVSMPPTGCCFSNNCINWSLDPDGYTINGECWNKEDQRHWAKVSSSLDLDFCLLNTNGVLVPSYQGNFHQSCTNCSLGNTLLVCNCRGFGGSESTKIDLDMVITQSEGILGCFSQAGRRRFA